MKYLLPLVMTGLFYSSFSHAYDDKVCYPTSGTPTRQSFSITKSLNKDQNTANNILVNTEATTGGGSTTFSCYCTSANTKVSHWWSSAAMFPVTKEGNYSWQALSPYLAASVEIYVYNSSGGPRSGTYHPVPFTGISNNTSADICGKQGGSAASGASGTVSVKIIKPAVGHIDFNGTVAKIWHYRKASYLNQADPVEVMVNLKIDISVPDGCTLLAGSVLNIDLGGQTRQTQFVGREYPQQPLNYTPRKVDLKFDCDFANSALDVVLSGNADDKGQGYATSSPDVSVVVTDASGNIIPPNTEAGMVHVDATTISDTLSLRAYPTNSGSNAAPEAAPYDATVTILLSYD